MNQGKISKAVGDFLDALGLLPENVQSFEVRTSNYGPTLTVRHIQRDEDGNMILNHVGQVKTYTEHMGTGWVSSEA